MPTGTHTHAHGQPLVPLLLDDVSCALWSMRELMHGWGLRVRAL